MIRVRDPVCGKEFDLHDAETHEDYHRVGLFLLLRPMPPALFEPPRWLCG